MLSTSKAGRFREQSAAGLRRRAVLLLLTLCVLVLPALRPAHAKPDLFPRPPELEHDVQFWIRVYTEIDTNSGFLHDENNLSVVYETLHFAPNTSSREREREVASARDRYVAALKRIATSGPLTEEDQRIRRLWGDDATPIRLLEATDHIRFQLGQSDRFREGLRRAGRWETHIAQTLANLGLPPELAVLPHVESSFNPAAYSKVGAAGLWQFMRSTGRRYMRIDSTIDDRLDPFHETEAAAQLLDYNYRLLGTWPLAITAWNHGAAGVRHAVETLGTDDIVKILRNYTSPSFGFASRNFYVSFLAALAIDRDPEKYFGHIRREPEMRFQQVRLPVRASVAQLERALDLDLDTLREYNPALRPACWRGRRPVPKGYDLRLPEGETQWTAELVAQRLASGAAGPVLVSASDSPRHRVSRGETLASLADKYGVSAEALARLNGLRPGARLRAGRYIRVPGGPATVQVAANTPPPSLAPIAAVQEGSTAERASTVAAHAAAATAATATDGAAIAGAATDGAPTTGEIAAGAATAGAATAGATALTRSTSVPATGVPATSALPTSVPATSAPPTGVPATSAPPTSPALAANTRKVSTHAMSGAARSASRFVAPNQPSGGLSPEDARIESAEDEVAVAAIAKPAAKAQPVSAAQAEALGPALGPTAVAETATTDPIDYSVSANDTIVVAAAETLGHYADWLQVSASTLRRLNHMRRARSVVMGHRIKLDFHRVSREVFEAKRREYHRSLEASYFAAHRIEGTQVYIARRGDSLWHVTQRYQGLPIWLLQQYNPDVDFGDMRPGTQIVVPRIEDVTAGG